MGAEHSLPETELPFIKKVDALKSALNIEGQTAQESVMIAAKELGISTESKTLSTIVTECYNICFGSSRGAPSEPMLDENTTAAELLEKLTAGEQQAECCICFDYLHERPVAAFTCKGKRTCAHFFHDDCAGELLRSAGTRPDKTHACPICRRSIDEKITAPKASTDPEGWFKCIDVESNGKLSRAHVMAVLVSQFPIDHAKLEEAMPTLWEKWYDV